MCPELEGRFAQLSDVAVDGLAMEMDAIGALLQHNLPSLTALRLTRNAIGDSGCARLAQALLLQQPRAWPGLTHLELQDNRIQAEGCAHLARALQQRACPALTHLALGRNDIGPEGCEALGQALLQQQQQACPDLCVLDLDSNDIGDDGCEHLAQALQQRAGRGLTHLKLGGNGIGDEGCVALAKALLQQQQQASRSLRYLELAENCMHDKGWLHLSQALQQRACPGLVSLDLQGCTVGSEACARLVRSLGDGCPDMECLQLRSTEIDAMPDALGELRCLTALDMSDNPIRRIPPALHGLILQLEAFAVDAEAMEEPPGRVVDQGLDALKAHIRAGAPQEQS